MIQFSKFFKKLAIFACLGSSVITYFTLKQYLKRLKYSHIPGPKTQGILEFYFGNFNAILKCLKEDKIISDFYVDLAKIYGPVFKFQFLGEYIVSTNDPEAIKEIIINKNFFKNERMYSKIGFPYGERFMGYGLVTETDDERWKKRRAVYNPGFHRGVLMSCLKEFNNKTDILMEKLRTLADGKTEVILYQQISRLTLDIISSVAFGFCIDTINYPDNDFSHNITKSFEAVNKCLTDPLFVINPFKKKQKDKFKNTIKELRNFAREKIVARLKKIENNEYAPDDILTAIVTSCKHEQIDIEDLVDDFITFFNAGQETTANTLAFCFLELGQKPDALKKLKEEIDRVLGAKTELTYEDMTQLVYTDCVFKETLRLWPPAPEIMRISNQDFYICGLKIPKNTQINLSPYFSGRNPKYFPEPNQFNPDRFLDDSNITNYTYFPFSIGARSCIGRNFALIESKVFIAKFLQNFDFELVPNQSNKGCMLTTLRPKDGTKCYLRPKSN